jgi:hypothetical protein
MQTRVAMMVMLALFGAMTVVVAVRVVRAVARCLERVEAFAAAVTGCPSPSPIRGGPEPARQGWPLRPIAGLRRRGHRLPH